VTAKSSTDRPLWIYWWLAFGLTWGAGGLALLTGNIRSTHPLHPLHYLAAFGPSLAGFVMAAATEGWVGVRNLLARVVPKRAHAAWYVAVLVLFPTACFIAAWIFDRKSLTALPAFDRLVFLVPATLVFDTGPLGEEFGWRGFALPRLLRRMRPLPAALLLGVIWGAWHLPTFFIQTLSQSELSVLLFFVNVLALSIIMSGLYLRTRGDMLLMILVHLMANYCGGIGIPFPAEVTAEVVLAALILAAGWLRPTAAAEEKVSEDFEAVPAIAATGGGQSQRES
jgi:membrane protease YdiL (CAAX protease family)